MKRDVWAVPLLALTLASACSDDNQHSHLEATKIGATSDIPAPRIDPRELGYAAECGPGGAAPEHTVLNRYPYLQQVTKTSAQVLWATKERGPYTVQVTRPGGEEVDSFESYIDKTGKVGGGGYQHVVQMTGLAPNTVYCYAIEAAAGELLAPTGFRTAPEPGTPLSFAAFGDSGGGGSDQRAVVEQLKTVQADLVVLTGDLAYNEGTLDQFEAEFFDMYEPILASEPAFPMSGNHDYETSDAAPYRAVFSLPENGGREGRERWYSFDWGDVHFVALDTEKVGQPQADWLEEDLSRNALPWTIAYMHWGPYSSGEHGSNASFRSLFSPILAAHHVQLVLSGHDHDYERTKPIDGITYVVTGGGGKGTRPVGESTFTEFSEDVLHFVYVTIDGDDLRLYAIDATGQEFDFTHITRSGAPTPKS